jgi:hypothetical protein
MFLIAAVALFSPACWADGTDPKAGTQGCGGKTGVTCDNSPIGTKITFTAFATGNLGDTATASVFDPLTTPVSEFLVTFQSMVNGESLSYSCDGSSELEGAMNCTPEGGTTFLFSFAPSSGETLCPAPPLSDTSSGSTGSSSCFVGETIILTIIGTDPTNLGGVALTASTSLVPEPASGLLLLFGLAAGGLAGLRKRIPFLA